MACREYEDRLAELEELLEGRLDASARARVEAHLAACADCREELDAVRESLAVLRQGLEPAPEASPAFFTRLGARLREAEAERVVVDFWGALELLSRRMAWTAAMGLLVVGSFLAGRSWTAAPAEPQAAAQVSELFSEPQRPVSHDDVLLSLAANGRAGRDSNK
jgi:anti-sigma factor RsiW